MTPELEKALQRCIAIGSDGLGYIRTDIGWLNNSVDGVQTALVTVCDTSTTITAGKKSVTIITGEAFAGTIQGATAIANMAYTFTATPGSTLDAIAVVITAGNFTVLTVS